MFPLNLQRNIVQLDKQISLLENECKNMEVEKKKKTHKPEANYSSCSKNLNPRPKPPSARISAIKNDNLKRNKKPTPPQSSRLQSSGSLPSYCSKTWSDKSEALFERKCMKKQFTGPKLKSSEREESKCMKCHCCKEKSPLKVDNAGLDVKKKDHVLLFPNPGGAIEVTVTQKSVNGKENSPSYQKSQVKNLNLEKEFEKSSNECGCQCRRQKWSEILCLESARRSLSNSGNCIKNKLTQDEPKKMPHSPNSNTNRRSDGRFSIGSQNNRDAVIHEGTFEIPVRLSSQVYNTKKQPESKSNKFEKEVQCSLGNFNSGEPVKELKDPGKIFQMLNNQFQQMSSGDVNKFPFNSDISEIIKDSLKENFKQYQKDSSPKLPSEINDTYLNAVKHHYESLIKEKSVLSGELAARDTTIATMRQREEEYLSLISKLKSNLEKTKASAQEGVEAVKEMNVIKSKLLEQIKVTEVTKKNLLKLQEALENSSLENDKLRTQIKIYKLEGQKHEILIAGKEAEIKRYREEIQNFQQQISEHLNSLKSSAQGVDVGKIMEAIMQQSQIFAQTDLDTVLEKDSSSKGQNILMHSSPTSAKTSVVNSSWKQISSIYDHDQSKANSEVIFLNEDGGNEKNFFQVFGGKPKSESAIPDKGNETENLEEKKEVKQSSSFTSCLSLDRDNSSVVSGDSVISKESVESGGEDGEGEGEGSKRGGFVEKTENNIDVLLRNMKLKFSKEIFSNSLPSCTTGDFLDISQISSISPL